MELCVLKKHKQQKGILCQGRAEWKRSDPEWSEITLEWKEVNNKVREQPWPQLVHCALICCHMCGCIFQKDGICC